MILPKLATGLAMTVLLSSHAAHAWAIGSQLNERGCHELITARALRTVRTYRSTAPAVTPTRDEAAIFSDVIFQAPADLLPDLAGMTLMLGVRDNDLKGVNPLSTLDLIQVHGNPDTQDEHCIRAAADDFAAGNQSAIENCRTFIRDTATAALDGLDATGTVDTDIRTEFKVYLAIRGQASPMLPLFWIKIGAAMHALEDGFPHTYRTADGMHITTVLNWIDEVDGVGYDEARDGPLHRTELDDCTHGDPTIDRNFTLATEAATDLLNAALDPTLTHDEKVAQFDAVTAKWLAYQPGCTFDNQWCSPPEATVTKTGCLDASGGGSSSVLVLLAVALLVLRRRTGLAALVLAGGLALPAYADDPPPAVPAAAPDQAPPVVDSTPAAPLTPVNGKEPGRDLKAPTVTEVQEVRKAKELGSPLGFTASLGGSIDRAAAVGTVGLRYRLNEKWLVGIDVGWNPWITTAPMQVRDGVAEYYLTLVRRFPMAYDRVNLRTSLHLGGSTLLFDVFGAPKYSTGFYGAISILGIDYDLGSSWRLVVDPAEIAFPVPEIGAIPLWYEQFRFMVGVQYGG